MKLRFTSNDSEIQKLFWIADDIAIKCNQFVSGASISMLGEKCFIYVIKFKHCGVSWLLWNSLLSMYGKPKLNFQATMQTLSLTTFLGSSLSE